MKAIQKMNTKKTEKKIWINSKKLFAYNYRYFHNFKLSFLFIMLNERNVFFYWRGHEYKLISLLRKLFYAYANVGKGYNLVFVNDENLNDYIKDVPKFVYKMPPAIIADYIRVNLICDYGGIYLIAILLLWSR